MTGMKWWAAKTDAQRNAVLEVSFAVAFFWSLIVWVSYGSYAQHTVELAVSAVLAIAIPWFVYVGFTIVHGRYNRRRVVNRSMVTSSRTGRLVVAVGD